MATVLNKSLSPHLLSLFGLRGLALRNRVVMAEHRLCASAHFGLGTANLPAELGGAVDAIESEAPIEVGGYQPKRG